MCFYYPAIAKIHKTRQNSHQAARTILRPSHLFWAGKKEKMPGLSDPEKPSRAGRISPADTGTVELSRKSQGVFQNVTGLVWYTANNTGTTLKKDHQFPRSVGSWTVAGSVYKVGLHTHITSLIGNLNFAVGKTTLQVIGRRSAH